MIDKKNIALKPLLDSKLISIEFTEDTFVLKFANGRTFIGELRLTVSPTQIEPQLNICCGHHTQPFKKGIDDA